MHKMPGEGKGKYRRSREKKQEQKQKYSVEHKEDIKEQHRKYNKEYRQIEVWCDICKCKVKKCRASKHLQTQKHINSEKQKKEEEEKLSKMTDEEKDEYLKVQKLQKILQKVISEVKLWYSVIIKKWHFLIMKMFDFTFVTFSVKSFEVLHWGMGGLETVLKVKILRTFW